MVVSDCEGGLRIADTTSALSLFTNSLYSVIVLK